MPKYTVDVEASPLLRDREEGELIEFKVAILRDGEEIDRIDQRYGVAVSDTEIHSDLTQKIDAIILEDYRQIQRTDTQHRAEATMAAFNTFEVNLP
jgi:hypothetical protein